MADVTRIRSQIESGDPHAAEQLLPLVHEAYLRLVSVDDPSGEQATGWNSRAHFFGAAAEAMRQILVDQAR